MEHTKSIVLINKFVHICTHNLIVCSSLCCSSLNIGLDAHVVRAVKTSNYEYSSKFLLMRTIFCLIFITLLFSCSNFRSSEINSSIVVPLVDTVPNDINSSIVVPLENTVPNDTLPAIDFKNVTYKKFHLFKIKNEEYEELTRIADTVSYGDLIIGDDFISFDLDKNLYIISIVDTLVNFDNFKCGQNIKDIPLFYPSKMHLFKDIHPWEVLPKKCSGRCRFIDVNNSADESSMPLHVVIDGEKIICVQYWSLSDFETD